MNAAQKWAWAAGLFEGEGCIHFRPHHRNPDALTRNLSLNSTDEDVVRRFHEIVGVGYVNLIGRRLEHHKDQWCWYCGKWSEIESVLTGMLPMLGERRRGKAEHLLAHPAVRNEEKTHCKRGHPFDEDNTYVDPGRGARHCRACALARYHARKQAA